MYKRFFKRFLDVFISFWGLVILSLPMALVAIAIKIDSEGPSIFKSERVGKNNKNFYLYKFRSMKVDAPRDVATRKIDAKIHITKVGNFIRKASLDELPQMWNIMKGDMSIIGPRPVVVTETDLIEKRRSLGVYAIRPGLTGWAQVHGRDTVIDMDKKANYDKYYVNNVSFKLDIMIFFKTIKIVFMKEGVVEGTQIADVTQKQSNADVDENKTC